VYKGKDIKVSVTSEAALFVGIKPFSLQRTTTLL